MSFLTKFFEFYKMYKEGVFDSIGDDVTKLRVREAEIWANLNNLERDVRTSQTRLCEIKDATVRKILELPGNVDFDAQHESFETTCRVIISGCSPFLVGPAGSGKSTILAQIASAMELPLRYLCFVSCKHF